MQAQSCRFVGKDVANPSKFVWDCVKQNSSFHSKKLQFSANTVVAEPEEHNSLMQNLIPLRCNSM